MAALSLRAKMSAGGSKDISGGLHSFPGSSRYILDYFSEEVLQRLPQNIQTFLERTSILERLCGSLCDEVIGDMDRKRGSSEEISHLQEPISGTVVLEYLERLNLFIIPLDEQREWYRYHRLFADLLNQRLFHKQPAMLPVLHQRASAWYARHQFWDEAIQHVFASGEVDSSTDLIQTAAEATLMRSEITTFRSWVERLPETEILKRPDLAVYNTLTQLWGGAPLDVIETSLAQIEKGKPSSGKDAPLRAFIALNRGEISKAREHAIQALGHIPESDVLLRGLADLMRAICHILDGEVQQGIRWLEKAASANRRTGKIMVAVLVLYQLAELNQKEGRLHQAHEFYMRALELATDTRGEYLPVAGRALVGMGEIAWAWNDLETAHKNILHGIELSEKWSHVSTFDGYLALAAIQQSQGDVKGAGKALRTLREIAQLYDITDIDDLIVDLFEARMNINRGDREAVHQWAKRRGLEEWCSGWAGRGAGGFTAQRLHKYEVLVAARMWLAEGKLEETLEILDQQLVELDKITRPALVIETELLRAQAFQEKKEIELAVQALEHALSMAEPEGFVRIFIDEGEKLRALCKAAQNKIHGESLRSFLDELLLAFPSGQTPLLRPQSLMTDLLTWPLSDREIQVLKLLPSSLSNQEIADELYISIHTLRSHLKNIYTKLGVHSRLEAIEIAGKLKLL